MLVSGRDGKSATSFRLWSGSGIPSVRPTAGAASTREARDLSARFSRANRSFRSLSAMAAAAGRIVRPPSQRATSALGRARSRFRECECRPRFPPALPRVTSIDLGGQCYPGCFRGWKMAEAVKRHPSQTHQDCNIFSTWAQTSSCPRTRRARRRRCDVSLLHEMGVVLQQPQGGIFHQFSAVPL